MTLEIWSLEDIKKRKLLSKYSPTYLLAKSLDLKYLIKEGQTFTGPSFSLAILIDKITSNFSVNSLLDLCCGTGAITKIALLNGVKKVTCVDLNLKVVKENLSDLKEKIELIKADVLEFKIKKFYDIVVLDAPLKIIDDFLKKQIKNFVNNCNIFIIWHGNSEDTEWNIWVRNELRNHFSKLMEVNVYGEEISCCSSTEKGTKWIEEFFKIWK
jgi:16S rRNA G966 N2-methylase RsmD